MEWNGMEWNGSPISTFFDTCVSFAPYMSFPPLSPLDHSRARPRVRRVAYPYDTLWHPVTLHGTLWHL